MGSIKINLLKSIVDPDLLSAEEARKELEENNVNTKKLLNKLEDFIKAKSIEVKFEKGRVRKTKFQRLAVGFDKGNNITVKNVPFLSFSYHKKEKDDNIKKDEELLRRL